LFADRDWAWCNSDHHNGVCIWIAGERKTENPNSDFVWKIANKYPDYINHNMIYKNWHEGEPNNLNGVESCAALWKKPLYTWNDYPCYKRCCFICENREFPIN